MSGWIDGNGGRVRDLPDSATAQQILERAVKEGMIEGPASKWRLYSLHSYSRRPSICRPGRRVNLVNGVEFVTMERK